jgi:hypothetical protein
MSGRAMDLRILSGELRLISVSGSVMRERLVG